MIFAASNGSGAMVGWILIAVHESFQLLSLIASIIGFAGLFRRLRIYLTAQGISLQTITALAVGSVVSCTSLLCVASYSTIGVISPLTMINAAAYTLLMIFTLIVLLNGFMADYLPQEDSFGQIFAQLIYRKDEETPSEAAEKHSTRLQWAILYVMAVSAAIFVEIARRKAHVLPFWISFLESLGDCITAFAFLPQLHMMHGMNKAGRDLPHTLGRFVVFALISRLSTAIYW